MVVLRENACLGLWQGLNLFPRKPSKLLVSAERTAKNKRVIVEEELFMGCAKMVQAIRPRA
jgi:hypothetical protein